MDAPSCESLYGAALVCLPGDGPEEAKADEEAKSSGEEDSPGVGREAGAKSGHCESPLEMARCTRSDVWSMAA